MTPKRIDTSVDLAIRIFGMQRSGNHAIIAWLQRNLPAEDTIFFNDCEFGHPLTSFNTVDMGGQIMTHRIRKVKRIPKLQTVLDQAARCPNHLISYENKQVEHRQALTDEYLTPGYASAPPFKDIVITRSFLNWLASFYKLKQRTRPKWLNDLNSVHIPAYMKHLIAAENDDVVSVVYDQWATDEVYREGVLAELGIERIDNGIGAMATYGRGSSFEGAKADPQSVAAEDRWRQLMDEPRFVDAVRVAFTDEVFRDRIVGKFGYSDEVLAQFGVTV